MHLVSRPEPGRALSKPYKDDRVALPERHERRVPNALDATGPASYPQTLGQPRDNPIDFQQAFAYKSLQAILPNRVHSNPFPEVLMKWAYLKMPHRCLPEANA